MESVRGYGILQTKEDVTSQLFLLLAAVLAGVLMFTLFREVGGTVHWKWALLIASLVAGVLAYAFKSIVLLPAAIAGVSTWWVFQEVSWSSKLGIKNLTLAAGIVLFALLLYVVSRYHERWVRPFGKVYLYTSAAPIAVALAGIFAMSVTFLYSTRAGLNLFQNITHEKSTALDSWRLTSVLIVLSAVLVVFTLVALYRKLIVGWEAGLVCVAGAVFITIALLPGKIYVSLPEVSSQITGAGIAYAVLANVFIFMEVLAVILVGYLKKKTWLVNVGAVLLMALVLVKYFDWFFQLISRGIFLVGAGLLFLCVSVLLERGRRYMVTSMNEGGA